MNISSLNKSFSWSALSLRTRLLITLGVVALLALIASDLVTYSQLRSALYGQAEQSLEQVHPSLEQALDSGDVLTISTVARLAPGMFVEIRDPAGHSIAEIPAFFQGGKQLTPILPSKISTPPLSTGQSNTVTPGSQSPTFGSPFSGNAFGQSPTIQPSTHEPSVYFTAQAQQSNGPMFMVRVSPLINGYQLILATPLSNLSSTLSHLMHIDELVTVVALLVALIVGWRLVIVGLKPLSKMEAVALEIADGDLSLRVPDETPNTEIGRLSGSFNNMIDRIQSAFSEKERSQQALMESEERMRNFVADASHELRTPLAAVSAYAELFDLGAQHRPEDLQRVMQGIKTESKRMSVLVEELMLLARLDEGRKLDKIAVELVSVCSIAVETSMAIGPTWPIEFYASKPVEVLGDPIRIRQVVDNLLTNIRVHTPAGTRGTVRVTQDDQWGVLEIDDSGPGMAQEQVSKVFSRFYRVDTSRSRSPVEATPQEESVQIATAPTVTPSSSGHGLGLSIVQSIVEGLGGSVELSSSAGAGAHFTVRLPLTSSILDFKNRDASTSQAQE